MDGVWHGAPGFTSYCCRYRCPYNLPGDAMVMVVKAAETDRDAFRRAVKSLEGVHFPLAGVVVNCISRRTSKGTYYYYYQYYQHYYGGYYGKDNEEEVKTEEVS